jgi:tetratricopeptide (TPR) repeat protein
MDYANQVIKIYPDHKGAVLLIARVFIAQGKKLLALDLIETSSRNVVSSEEISFERVKLILSISGARAALPAAKELANNFEKNPLIYKMLAEIQSELGDHKNASDSAEKSIQLNPRQPDLYHLIGKLKKETGDLDQAIHFLKEALQYQPDSLDIYYDLSQAYVDKREFLLALGVYEQIIKKAPGDYQPYYSAAMIQRDIKNYQEAEKMLRKAADLAPNDLNIRRQLGAVIALNLVHNKQEAG